MIDATHFLLGGTMLDLALTQLQIEGVELAELCEARIRRLRNEPTDTEKALYILRQGLPITTDINELEVLANLKSDRQTQIMFLSALAQHCHYDQSYGITVRDLAYLHEGEETDV